VKREASRLEELLLDLLEQVLDALDEADHKVSKALEIAREKMPYLERVLKSVKGSLDILQTVLSLEINRRRWKARRETDE